MTRLRIVLADDHETVRAGLKVILNSQPDMHVVGEAADGSSAVEEVQRLKPDLVVVDVSMPGMNGVKTTEALRASCPSVNVLGLTRHADRGYVQQLLNAGASGYVLKQSRASEILHAIRAIAHGGTYLDPAVAEKALEPSPRRPHGAAVDDRPGGLSPREAEVLRLAAWGYSNKEMAHQLDLSVKTIETHKANGMQKLGMSNRIDIVRFALLHGWLEEA